MNGKLLRIVLLVILASGFPAPSPALEPPGYRITPEPDWADALPCEPPATVPEDELDDGVYYFLVDETERMATAERYGQFARKIVNEAGAQNGSEIHISFDPAYQSIDLHRVDVLRDGVWQPRLDPAIVTLLQREQEMERFLLDGSYTLVIRLPDIRPGDLLRYAFTRRGANPVMGGRYYRSFTAGSSVPWKTLRQRILGEPDQPIEIRAHATSLAPVVEGSTYEWRAEDLPVILAEEHVPEWITIYPWIEASGWKNWAEVVRWAIPLYPRDQPLPEELETRLTEWRTLPDPAAQAGAALRFTQDQVRYLGVASGIHSHQPRPPGEVCGKRFGDCKEKVLLLMHLLDRLGIENHPVFVNTAWGRGIEGFLPSPYAFDHVILEVVIAGESYFVDPTRTSQRGPFAQLYIPDYGFGLRVREGEAALIPVRPWPESEGGTQVREHFVLSDIYNERPSTMRITTTHEGARAEAARREFAESSLGQLQEQYLEFYAKRFPSVELAAPMQYSDDPEANRFTIEESYRVPTLWQPDSDQPTVLTASLFQDDFGSRFSWPNRATRRWPYRLAIPARFSIDTQVELPEDWPEDSQPHTAGGKWFNFEYLREIKGATARLAGRYEAKVPEVLPEEIAAYRVEAEKAYDEIGYQFTYDTAIGTEMAEAEAPWSPNLYLIGVMAATLTASCAGGIAVLSRNRRIAPNLPAAEDRHLDGLRGWLILVAIGVVLSPFRILMGTIETVAPFMEATAWQTLTDPESLSYHQNWGPLLTFTVVANLILLAMAVVCLVLFFQKRRRFPQFFIAFSLAHLAALLFDFGFIHLLPVEPDAEANPYTDLTRAVIGCAIWIPYMLFSKRVKATFRH